LAPLWGQINHNDLRSTIYRVLSFMQASSGPNSADSTGDSIRDTNLYIGVAGWNLRKETATEFPAAGSHLQRYAARINAVEINTSFYRPHRHSTYERWAASTPASFRFSVKLPKAITHERRLRNCSLELGRFAEECAGLAEKLGPILVQLPPSLTFDPAVVEPFFIELRMRVLATLVCEPRHQSWFAPVAERMLRELGIGRVAADPAMCPQAAEPGGCEQTVYVRWHGSPRMYYTRYEKSELAGLAERLASAAAVSDAVWCIFDNTAEGAAVPNALDLRELVQRAAKPAHKVGVAVGK
jgi:uncharacterized protein YecE (DUF72 family)